MPSHNPSQPVLIDVGAVPASCCDDALETLHKALSNPPGHDIWAPHESPFITALIERFSVAGLTNNEAVVSEVLAWLDGLRSEPGVAVARPLSALVFTSGELAFARIYLSHLPMEQWGMWELDLLINYLFQRYLPRDVLQVQAEMLAVKSNLMGHVQALHPTLSTSSIAQVVSGLPASRAAAVASFRMPSVASSVLDYGVAHCCEQVQSASASFRHAMKSIVMDHQSQVMYGEAPAVGLQQKLFDALGAANRDWRRIALTEAGEMANQGFLSALQPGAKVRRLEAYTGACAFCAKMDKRIFRVTTATDPDKDGDRDVWPGKTNVGRSASPMRRGLFGLTERTPSEMWWQAAGTNHPHCRGQWHVEIPAPAGSSDEFAAWLETHLATGRKS